MAAWLQVGLKQLVSWLKLFWNYFQVKSFFMQEKAKKSFSNICCFFVFHESKQKVFRFWRKNKTWGLGYILKLKWFIKPKSESLIWRCRECRSKKHILFWSEPRSWNINIHRLHTHPCTGTQYLRTAKCLLASVFQPISVQGGSVVIDLNLIWRVLAGWFSYGCAHF